MTAVINPDEIRRSLSLLHEPGSIFEIRIPGKYTISEQFSDIERALSLIEREGRKKPKGIYVTLNPVAGSEGSKNAAHDEDISARRWFLIDIDPKRPVDTSSTDAEHQAAIEKAARVKDFLSERGWSEPISADSGNGAHLLYRVDLPNDEVSKNLLKSCLNVLKGLFSDSFSDVDISVFNASRISKIYGTVARKGADTPERPHRTAKIINTPEDIEPVSARIITQLSSLNQSKQPEEDTRKGSSRRKVKTGEIDNYLTSQAGKLFNQKLRDMDLFNELSRINQEDCDPPAEDSDIRRICASALRNFSMPGGSTRNPKGISEAELKEHDDRVKVQELKFDIRVPEDHFISKYVAHMTDKTDAYPDYHYAAALTLLSIAADRRVYTHIKNTGEIYSNLWFMCLGQSSFSRKSTALNMVKIVAGANSSFATVPGMFSTEGLIETFHDNPRGYLVKDEAAQILGSINKKQYMSDVRDVLCELYDCGDIKRKLRTSKKTGTTNFDIHESYPVFLMATTPDNFFMNTTRLDLTSGWLIRFLYVYPRYKKSVKGLELGTLTDKVNLQDIGTLFNDIAGAVSAFDKINIHPSREALTRFNTWFIAKQEELESSEEDTSLSQTVFARILITALKIAALLTLGDSRCKKEFAAHGVTWAADFKDIKENHHLEPEITIPDEFMEESIRLVDEYFLPIASEIIEDLISRENENIQGRIIQFLKTANHCRLTRSELLRKVKLTSKVLDEHIQSLIEQDLLEERIVPNTNPVKLLYLLKKAKENNKSILEFF
jgi:DNA-binding HxlR family transcriptional regulator